MNNDKRKVLAASVLLAMASGSIQAAGEIQLGNDPAVDAPYTWDEATDNVKDVTILKSAVIYIEDGDNLNELEIDANAADIAIPTLTLATEIGINANGTHDVHLDSITRPTNGSDTASGVNLLVTTTADGFDGDENLLLDVNGDVDLGAGTLKIRSTDTNITSNETKVMIGGDLNASATTLNAATGNSGDATDVVLQFNGSNTQEVNGAIDGGSDFEGVVNVISSSSTVTFNDAIGATNDVNQVNVTKNPEFSDDSNVVFEESVNANKITVEGIGNDVIGPPNDLYLRADADFMGTVTADVDGITLRYSDTEFEDNVTVNNAGNLTSTYSDVTLDGALNAIAGDVTLRDSIVNFTDDDGSTTVGGNTVIDESSLVNIDNTLAVDGNLHVTNTDTFVNFDNDVTVGTESLTSNLTIDDSAEANFTKTAGTVKVFGNLLVDDAVDTVKVDDDNLVAVEFANVLIDVDGNLTLSNSTVDFTNETGATTVGGAALIDQNSVVDMNTSLSVTGDLTATGAITSLDVDNTVTVTNGNVLVADGAELDVLEDSEVTAGSLTVTNSGSVATFQNNASVSADLTVSDSAEGHFTGAGSTVTVGGNLLVSDSADTDFAGASNAITGNLTLSNSNVDFTNETGATTVDGAALIDQNSVVDMNTSLSVTGDLTATGATTSLDVDNTVTVTNGNVLVADGAELDISEDFEATAGSLTVTNSGSVATFQNNATVGADLTVSDSAEGHFTGAGSTVTVGGNLLVSDSADTDFAGASNAITGNITLSNSSVDFTNEEGNTTVGGNTLIDNGSEVDINNTLAVDGDLDVTNTGTFVNFDNNVTVGTESMASNLTIDDSAEANFTKTDGTLKVYGNLLVDDAVNTEADANTVAVEFSNVLIDVDGNLTLSNSSVDFTNEGGNTTVGGNTLINEGSVVDINNILAVNGDLDVTNTGTFVNFDNDVTVGTESLASNLTIDDSAEANFTKTDGTLKVFGNLLVDDAVDTETEADINEVAVEFSNVLIDVVGNLTLSNSNVNFTNEAGATTVGGAALIDQNSVVDMNTSLSVTGDLTATGATTSLDVDNTVTVTNGNVLVADGAELDISEDFEVTAGSLTVTNSGSVATFGNNATVGADLTVSDSAEGHFMGDSSTVAVGGNLLVSDSADTDFAGASNAITGNITLSNSSVDFTNGAGATTVGGAALFDQNSVVDMDTSLSVTGDLTATGASTLLDVFNTVTVTNGNVLVADGAELDVLEDFEVTAGSLTVTNSGSVATFRNNVTVGADLTVSDSADSNFAGASNTITGDMTLSNANVDFTNGAGATTVGGAALIDGGSSVSFATTLDVTGVLTIADEGTLADFDKDVVADSIAISGATATFGEDVTGAILLANNGLNVGTAVFSDDENTINSAITVAGDGQGKIQVVDTANSSAATFSKSVGAEGLALGLLDADGANVVLLADVYANAVQVRGSATDEATLMLDSAASLNLGGDGLSIDSTAGSDALVLLEGDFSGAVSMGASTGTIAHLDLDNEQSEISGDLLVTDSTGTVDIDVGDNAYTSFKGSIGSEGNAVDNFTINGNGSSEAFTQFGADKSIYATHFKIEDGAKAVMLHNTIIGETFSNAGFLRVEDTLTFTGEMTVELASEESNSAVLDFTGVENFSNDTVISAKDSVVSISSASGMTVQFDEWLNYGEYVLIDENLDVTQEEADKITLSAPNVRLAKYQLSIVDGNLQLNWFQKDAAELTAENRKDFTKNDYQSNYEDSEALLIAATINESKDGAFGQALRKQLLAGNTAATAEQLVNNRAAMDGTQQALTGIMMATSNLINDRSSAVGGRGVSSGDDFETKSVWIKPFVSVGEKDSNASFAGFETDTKGLSLGMDGNLTDYTTVGIALGYYQTDIDANDVVTSSSDIEGYQLGLYSAHNTVDWYLNSYVGYADNDTNSRRTVNFMGNTVANANYDTDQYSVNVSAGRMHAVGSNGTLTPNVSMNYTHLAPHSYTETGFGGYSLIVDQNKTDVALLSVGLNYNNEFERGDSRFISELRVNAMYDLVGDEVVSTSRYSGGGAAFTVTGAEVDRASLGLGFGLKYVTDNVTVTASYDAELKDEYTAHTASIDLRFGF